MHIDVGEEERYAHEQRIRDLIRVNLSRVFLIFAPFLTLLYTLLYCCLCYLLTPSLRTRTWT